MDKQNILVPDIGDYTDVDVIEVCVSVGDTIQAEETLMTLETDKATMEIPAPQAGKVVEIAVKEGDKVSEGALILKLDSASSDVQLGSEVHGNESPVSTSKMDQLSPLQEGESSIQSIQVPDIGEYSDVDVIEINVKKGDQIQAEETLITLETDKATMEVPAPMSGKVVDILIKEGDKVSQGSIIVTLESEISGDELDSQSGQHNMKRERSVAHSSSHSSTPVQAAPELNPVHSAPLASAPGKGYASPSMRRFARELGVDLSSVPGSGRKGRITRTDIQKQVKSVMESGGKSGGSSFGLLPDPVVDFAKFGDVRVEKLSRIQKISGDNLARNWVRIPHITLFDDANITELETFRKGLKIRAEKSGVKITPVPFIVKAVAMSLREFPIVNSSLSSEGESLVKKDYVHIGVAVDTPNGLMVPVIRHADKKGIFEIARDLSDLATKAKEGKLKGDEMQGGCFTISSLGGLGTKYFTPIVNMPEVAILGVSKAEMKPIWNGEEFTPSLMLPLSLSLDHRVVDGAEGARFLTSLVRRLSDLRESIL